MSIARFLKASSFPLAFATVLFSFMVDAAVYKCSSPSGGTMFSDKPCPNALRKDGNQWVDVEAEARKKREDEEHQRVLEQARLEAKREAHEAQMRSIETLIQTKLLPDHPPSSTSTSPSAISSPSSQTVSMSFEQCIAKRESVIAALGVNPHDIKPIVNTGIVTTTRICTSDGSVLITCSGPDQKMVITQSNGRNEVGCR